MKDRYFMPYDKYDFVAMGLLIGILAVIMVLFGSCDVAQAEPIPERQAVLAILGESLPDNASMVNMAHALRNRGSLKGVYGLKSAQGKVFSPKTYQRALKAWKGANMPYSVDSTKGATHWLSDYDLKHCKPSRMAWRFKMKETLYQGKTHYFKPID
jgi:hypothetical protein